MAKIVINGETFDYDGQKQPLDEALWIEQVYQRRYGEWQDDLAAGGVRAVVMLACLIWRRDGRNTDTAFQDILGGEIEFDLREMLVSMADAGRAMQQEAADAAAAPVPTTPGQSPAPAGSPTTSTAISASSRSTSGSGRGKSGSSKSRTSRP